MLMLLLNIISDALDLGSESCELTFVSKATLVPCYAGIWLHRAAVVIIANLYISSWFHSSFARKSCLRPLSNRCLFCSYVFPS